MASVGSSTGASTVSGVGMSIVAYGLAEAVTAADGTTNLAITVDQITEILYAFPIVDPVKAIPQTLTAGVIVTPTVSYVLGLTLVETLRITAAEADTWIGNLSLAEQVRLLDVLLVVRPVTLSETINVSHVMTAVAAVALIEQLQLRETLSQAAVTAATLTDRMALTAVLAKFIGMSLTENMTVTDAQALATKLFNLLTETAAVTAAITPSVVVRVIAADTLSLDDVDALHMVYKPTISESMVFEITYVSPGGGLTTWVMNTRSGGVTEYDNFSFNSYAEMGQRYIAAAADGLYELDGATDAGASIIAEIAGGFLQFGDTHLSRLQAAYIGMRGSGEFFLKIEAGDGPTYTYKVDTRSMRSTKVHMGRGQRARYFAYTLTSTGSDFDLDSIEFVPLTLQRRV